jgi:hypothetical protein
MTMEIDYNETDSLVEQPLVYCKQPKLLYDTKELTLYITRDDASRVLDCLGDRLGLNLSILAREDKDLIVRTVNLAKAKSTIAATRDPYSRIYATPKPLGIPPDSLSTHKQEDSFWRRSEVIRVDSPIRMDWRKGTPGLLYYIEFANEFIDGEVITQKSAQFQRCTQEFTEWLHNNFVNWRGPRCFDNANENVRLFDDRYRSKAR